MRRRTRAIRSLSLLLAVVPVSACYNTTRHPMPHPIQVTDTMVVPWKGQPTLVFGAHVEGDSVLAGSHVDTLRVGGLALLRPGPPRTETVDLRIPLAELYAEEHRLDVGRSVLLGVGVTLAFSAWYMACCFDLDLNFGFSGGGR